MTIFYLNLVPPFPNNLARHCWQELHAKRMAAIGHFLGEKGIALDSVTLRYPFDGQVCSITFDHPDAEVMFKLWCPPDWIANEPRTEATSSASANPAPHTPGNVASTVPSRLPQHATANAIQTALSLSGQPPTPTGNSAV